MSDGEKKKNDEKKDIVVLQSYIGKWYMNAEEYVRDQEAKLMKAGNGKADDGKYLELAVTNYLKRHIPKSLSVRANTYVEGTHAPAREKDILIVNSDTAFQFIDFQLTDAADQFVLPTSILCHIECKIGISAVNRCGRHQLAEAEVSITMQY